MRRPDSVRLLVILTTSNYSIENNLKTGYDLFTESYLVYMSIFLRSYRIFLVINWMIYRLLQEETFFGLNDVDMDIAENTYIQILTVTEMRIRVCPFTTKYMLKPCTN
jgi:hypothetical protein